MSQDLLVPMIRRARRLPLLAVATAGAFLGASAVIVLWSRPVPITIEVAPLAVGPERSCPDLVCPQSLACPSLTCSALPSSPPVAVKAPATPVRPVPAARAWSKQLGKHIDEYTAPDEEGYSTVVLAGDFVVAVEPYLPEEDCASTPASSGARAFDRATGNLLWTIPVDDRTSLVATSAGLLVVVNDKGPDTNSLRLLDRNKRTLWATPLDECGALYQQGKWLVDSPVDPRCARDLSSGVVYHLPDAIREDRQSRDAYWQEFGLPGPGQEITCPKVDYASVYAGACDAQGTAQVSFRCSGKNCRATIDYTPWTASVRRPAAR